MSIDVLKRWKEVAQKNPVILFEQGWVELGNLTPEQVAPLYIQAAEADPTSAARLIHHIENQPFAADVLAAAFTAFPLAAETYPDWKKLPFADTVRRSEKRPFSPGDDEGAVSTTKSWTEQQSRGGVLHARVEAGRT